MNFKNHLIMFRKSDNRYFKLRNEKIDEIKREIMSLYDSSETCNKDIIESLIDEKKKELLANVRNHSALY